MTSFAPLAQLVGRILIALIFIVAGWEKVAGYAGTQAYMESQGVPGAALPLVILLELGGGIAIIAGFMARIVAPLLAGFCILSALLFHLDFSDQTQMIMFMKNLAMAGGFLFLFASGAGPYSIDGRRGA